MIAPADPMGARPLRGVEPVAPGHSVSDPQREVFNRLTQIALGKMFHAEVVSKFDDGTHLVKIDNAAFKAVLPGDPQVGDSLALKFVASQPRPTFLLMPQSGADTASLSSAAKLIGNILQATAQDAEAATTVGKVPVLIAASDDAPAIASALKTALTMSGVFYESHLRQWAEGTRSLAELQQEPQARSGMLSSHGAASLARPDSAASAQSVAIVSNWDSAFPAAAHAGSAVAALAAEHLSNESMQLMNLQLQTLEQGKFIWQGELWPGQPLEWEVSEDKAQQHEAQADNASWTSTVRFTLPTLGVVSAHIHLSDQRVQMHLHAASEQTASLLHRHGTELASALDAAGSPLEAFSVKQDAKA